MQYSPSAKVSWIATDWSMLGPAGQTHPGEQQIGAPFGQHVIQEVMQLLQKAGGQPSLRGTLVMERVEEA